MTELLHLPPRPGARVACDMTTAVDTPAERLGEYGRLFAAALLRRERTADAVILAFRSDPETRDRVLALAKREAACCPFLDYRVETAGDELHWTLAGPVDGDDRGSIGVILDGFHAGDPRFELRR